MTKRYANHCTWREKCCRSLTSKATFAAAMALDIVGGSGNMALPAGGGTGRKRKSTTMGDIDGSPYQFRNIKLRPKHQNTIWRMFIVLVVLSVFSNWFASFTRHECNINAWLTFAANAGTMRRADRDSAVHICSAPELAGIRPEAFS